MQDTQITIKAEYAAIESIRALCKPWIDLYSGDRWGVGMNALWVAGHTDQAFTHEACAKITGMLLENLIDQRNWMVEYGQEGYAPLRESVVIAQALCRTIREYWLTGGNLGDRATGLCAREAIDNTPGWMYGE